jgi:hypothetical protein
MRVNTYRPMTHLSQSTLKQMALDLPNRITNLERQGDHHGAALLCRDLAWCLTQIHESDVISSMDPFWQYLDRVCLMHKVTLEF